MIAQLLPCRIAGCFQIITKTLRDHRGDFTKLYASDFFAENHLEFSLEEEYFSISKRNVLRGLHFQVPHMEHVKLVHCMYGKALDVVVDLRKGSPTYGQHEKFNFKFGEKI